MKSLLRFSEEEIRSVEEQEGNNLLLIWEAKEVLRRSFLEVQEDLVNKVVVEEECLIFLACLEEECPELLEKDDILNLNLNEIYF